MSFPHDSCLLTDLSPGLEATALMQYNLKRGLKEFGNDRIVALGKEMEQLHTRKVGKPIDSNNLTKEQKEARVQESPNANAHEYLQHRNFSQRMNKEVVRCRETTTIGTNNGEAYPAHQLIT